MNNYVTLDGKKYSCPFKEWEPVFEKPVSARFTWAGAADVTFGNGGYKTWSGSIRAQVTPASGFGSVSDIRNTIAKLTTVGFQDHYGDKTYTVAVEQIGPERSISAKWDGASNVIFFPVRLTMINDGTGIL